MLRSLRSLTLILVFIFAVGILPASANEPTPQPTEFGVDIVFDRCLIYLPYIQYWSQHPQYGFPYLDPALVLAVGATESGCDSSIVSSVGALGWLQVMPKSWTPPGNVVTQDGINTLWGMRILSAAIEQADGDWYLGLAFYNCSKDSVHNGNCGDNGGIAYAERVLTVFYPHFQKALGEVALGENGLMPWLEDWQPESSMTEWLMGYGYGLPSTPTFTPQPSPTATITPTPENTPLPTLTPSAILSMDEPDVPPEIQSEDHEMKILTNILTRSRLIILLIISLPFLLALTLLQVIGEGTMAAIAFLISVFIGLLGPKPMEVLIKWLKLEGQWAVLFVYAVSFVIGALGLLLSKELFSIPFTWDNALAIAGLMFAAATYAFHRLKDQKKLP